MKITPLSFWKHYKGSIYCVITVATNSETEEELVIYHKVADKKIWARPLKMWNEDVNGQKRFTPHNPVC